MTDPLHLLIIPAWNEEANLADVLTAAAREAEDFEIVVVDDGSSDRTAEIARECGARVLRHTFNMGYGAALQTGYKYALRRCASLVVQMDADGQHDAAHIGRLSDPILNDELDLAIGSRFLDARGYHFGLVRRAGRALFGAIAGWFGLRITDPTSGFQAMNTKVLQLYAGDFFPSDFPDVDVLLAAHRCGLRVGERSVGMDQGTRASTIHGGLKPLYYGYKMLLSIWAGSR